MHNCRFFELRWKKPMKMMNSIIMTGFGRISAACGCHTGRRRKNNEDNFFFAGRYMASDNNGLGSILEKSFSLKKDRFFAVFDGMGGGEYGEIASYIAAKATEQYLNAEEAANLAGKKDYLEKMIKTAHVISDTSKDDEVGINNTVQVYIEEDDETETYKLVTTVRGNSLKGYVSIDSPLGKAILGHKVGDRVTVKVSDAYSYDLIIKSIENTADTDDELRSY